MKEYCFGIDVGGTTVKMGLFRTDGTLLDKWEIPTRTENGGEAILPDIAASALGRLEKMGLTKEMVEGIGIDVPGPINEEGVVPHTANLGWGYKEVTRELEELTGSQITASIDLNGMTEGDYTVPVNISLPEGYEQVDSVQVSIQLRATPDTSQ